MPDAHILRMPRDDEELHAWVAAMLGVDIPRVQVCPDHVAPFTAFADAFFARHPVAIWKASRGLAGKSFMLAALCVAEMIALDASVTILGGSGAQSQNVNRYTTELWSAPFAPRYLLQSDPGKFETVLSTGAWLRVLLASQRSARGPHPTRLRLDEIDEMDLAIFDAAMGQPMERNGVAAQTVASSTHQYPDGTMAAVLRRAADQPTWATHEWCYKESMQPHGWLTPQMVEQKKTEVTRTMWAVEYELQEPSAEGRAFLTEHVEALFDPTLGIAPGEENAYVEFEEPEKPFGVYVTAADWARDVDWTIIATFRVDCTPWRCVAWERRGRQPYPVMAARFSAHVKRYDAYAVHDATGGGAVMDDILDVAAEPFVMTAGLVRRELFSAYVQAVENGDIRYPQIAYAYREHKFCSNDALFKAGGHPPDSVVAGALAWSQRASVSRGYLPMAGGSRVAYLAGRG